MRNSWRTDFCREQGATTATMEGGSVNRLPGAIFTIRVGNVEDE